MAPAVKRPAADELEGEQRLAKRFDGLHLDRNGFSHGASSELPPKAKRLPRFNDDEWMDVDAGKHKVFIHDLDKELEEVESDDERPIFVQDIEKHLMRIPQHVLVEDRPKDLANKQLVLYGAPVSLTVPQDKDSVRRAIIEARQRARDTQALRVPDASTVFPHQNTSTHGLMPFKPAVNGMSIGIPNPLPNGLANGLPHFFTHHYSRAADPDVMDMD